MSTADAAALLGCTRQHLAALIRAGRLPAQRLSPRVLLVRRADVEAYAQRQFPRGWKRGRKRKATPTAAIASAPAGTPDAPTMERPS